MTRLMTTFRAVLTMSLIVSASAFARADIYALDPQHSEVRFSWDHLGLSRQGGRFTSIEGTVAFDPDTPATTTVDVKIPVKSISTGIKKLDEHLVGTKDFFDVTANPFITFKSTGVRLKSDKTADMDGDLTINGITKPVVLEVIWNFTGEHPLQNINPVYTGAYASGFSASTQIRRSDWGITRTIPYVSDELRITIETEMLRTSVTAKPDDGAAAPDTGAPASSGITTGPVNDPIPSEDIAPNDAAPLPDDGK